MEIARYGASTIKSYLAALSVFFKENSQIGVENIDENIIEKYLYKTITEKNISADAIQHFLPHRNNNSRSLAIIPQAGHPGVSHANAGDFNTERDILYKLFFDLKKDMNDLKQMIFDVAHHQGYTPADPSPSSAGNLMPVYNEVEHTPMPVNNFNVSNLPILLESNDHHEDVEETLFLADREKEYITKALKKHKSRRRDAAAELGISERTLYRKIKEYGIQE